MSSPVYPVSFRREVADGMVQLTFEDYRWYARETDAETLYYPSVSYILSHGWPKGQGFHQWLANLPSYEDSRAIMEQAGHRGSKVHIAGHAILLGEPWPWDRVPYGYKEPLSGEEMQYVITLGNFLRIYQPIITRVEETVYSEEHGYAGTLDLECLIDEALLLWDRRKKRPPLSGTLVRVSLDWKTSGDIYMTHKLQIAAYNKCYPEAEYFGVVQLGNKSKEGFKLWVRPKEPAPGRRNYFDAFMLAKGVFDFQMGQVDPKIYDVPEVLDYREFVKQDESLKDDTQRPEI
jgi:hypothetical protein